MKPKQEPNRTTNNKPFYGEPTTNYTKSQVAYDTELFDGDENAIFDTDDPLHGEQAPAPHTRRKGECYGFHDELQARLNRVYGSVCRDALLTWQNLSSDAIPSTTKPEAGPA